ncbi:immunoglobulin-like domain-containing protein, partial [Polaribacter sp.]|uniref:immunoglobulin-like domain-containing protein n=1 Tax=Polaribacter sp. TaxID=1920175 RepID=UPI0040475F26
GITNTVFYDSEVYTFNQESVGKQHQVENPNLTSSAIGKQTADMKLIAIYSDANWSISDTNATSAVWGINTSLNNGYPYFNFNTASLYLPSLSLIGAKSIYMLLGDEYLELGAVAADYLGNDITDKIIVDSSKLDKDTEGNYSVFYNVSDNLGNKANTQLRNIKVRPEEYFKPVITLIGQSSITHEKGDAYVDEGALARNYLDQDISYKVVVTGAVDITEVGTYALYYNVTDSFGNIGNQIIRTITVVDTSIERFRPTITLNGSKSLVIKEGTSYQELGAIAIDYNGNDISSDIVIDASAVAVNSIGTYTVKYDVVDQEGYNAITETRTVIVKETNYFKPTLSLVGDTEITLSVGQNYREFGAKAIDYNGNDISDLIVTTGNVDTSKSGTYVVKYNVTDTLGNIASEIRRTITVNIVEGSYNIPIVTLNGDQKIYMNVNDNYIELGATATDYLGNDISQYIEINDSNLDTKNIGIYYVIYTVEDNEGGKSNPAIRIVVVQNVLGVSDVENENEIAIYPNPTSSMLHINVDYTLINQRYIIVDALGRDVLKGNLNQVKNTINLEQLSKGIYYLKVSNKKTISFIKK